MRILGALFLAALGCQGPAAVGPPPTAPAKPEGRLHGTLAVLEFEVVKGVDIDRLYFSDKVRGDVGRLAPDLFVMTRESTEVLLKAAGKTALECEGECEVEIGRRLSADYVISGRIAKVGTRLLLTLRLHSTADARMVGSEEAQGRDADELVDGSDAAVARLLGIQVVNAPPRKEPPAPAPAPKGGFIEVSVYPRAAAKVARISIDGKPSRVGRQGPFAAGRHDVLVEARGFRDTEDVTEVEDGRTTTFMAEMVSLAPEPAPAPAPAPPSFSDTFAGVWQINANDWIGRFELTPTGGGWNGRIWFDRYGRWEPLLEIVPAADHLTFYRPEPNQAYTGTLTSSGLSGTFTDHGGTYLWHAWRAK